MRETEQIHTEQTTRGTKDTHPAFGVAVVTRGHGNGTALFQSDVLHNDTITLSINRATRGRDLNHDWVHPEDTLVEVQMSLAQWGALVSSIGIGSGVPVTIRSTESNRRVPDLPFAPRIAASLGEVKGSVQKLLAQTKDTLADLTSAIEEKRGVKAVREALRKHHFTIHNAEANAAYAVTSMAEAAEGVVSQAKADIEAHILSAAMATGLEAPIVAPTFAIGDSSNQPAVEDRA